MNIISEKCNYTIHTLQQEYLSNRLIITDFINTSEPWKTSQKKAFIESLMLGFPSQDFITVYDEHDQLIIVDGIKRFLAIMDFLNDDFSVNPSFSKMKGIFEDELKFSEMARKWQYTFENITLCFKIHKFPNKSYAKEFEERLHRDFEILGTRVRIIDRCIYFNNDEYVEALNLLSKFNAYLIKEYSEKNISIRIEQEENKIRLIVDADGTSKTECEKILNKFEKHLLRDETNHSKNNGFIVNIHNTNQNKISNELNFHFDEKLRETRGLLNQLIEEIDSNTEIQIKLKKALDSSRSITNPEEFKDSAFFSRVSDLLKQAKTYGTDFNKLVNNSKECIELIKNITDSIQALTGFF
ncbi:DUF262 domain-containing protein [Aeromonas jandaei]|uniref:DUF262 domain-containing protein n=1 Tax=Aeromonas jandaei TaxID=650 RepID=UPI003BA32ACA